MTRVRGESVAPGIAVGPVVLRGFDAEDTGRRITADEVEAELNRLREALDRGRAQIEEIKQKQSGSLGEAELRIFDAHLAYLGDAMFVTEIENQVMQERLSVREAVQLVFTKYDRIFQLVESDLLRRRASDLRDVATRLLRNLEEGGPRGAVAPTGPYILAARKLTTADMFNLDNEKVEGIVAEEGGMSSHAAILARGMGIPTVTGLRDLPKLLRAGDVVVLDASAGELVTAPDEAALAEATARAQQWKAGRAAAAAPSEVVSHQTRDGTPVRLLGACGSQGEADLVHTFGMEGVGVYRTELQFLVEKVLPTEDALVATYQGVIQAQAGRPVAFRLLDVMAATIDVGQRHQERNPAMGQRGVRGLLVNQAVLRLQLRAILRAAAGAEGVAVLVPFVTSISDLQRVKAALLEERVGLKKARVPFAADIHIAPVIEVPAAAMSLGALLNESDFAVVAIDDLQAHLLGADRDNAAVREYHEMVHPAVFEMLARMAKDAERREKALLLFGESAADPVRFPFYLGVGYRSFAIAPVRLRAALRVLSRYSIDECRRIAARILEAPRTLDVQKVLVNLDLT
ncbi:MAG: phosphoenolpyruvate--protein phosphotransferase [Planctomycetes bacterium]|nr:phosphoenolpyruvate--protein phosphotransferase [Planctomycetota bacterium]